MDDVVNIEAVINLETSPNTASVSSGPMDTVAKGKKFSFPFFKRDKVRIKG